MYLSYQYVHGTRMAHAAMQLATGERQQLFQTCQLTVAGVPNCHFIFNNYNTTKFLIFSFFRLGESVIKIGSQQQLNIIAMVV